jgi:DNA polymerase III subunit delta'
MMLPWQSPQWSQLTRLHREGRMPHALLLTGMAGIGKAQFAEAFSQFLFCAAPSIEWHPCGECHGCRMHAGRAHPNILWIEPEKEGSVIKVDQIRAVTEFINQSSLQGNYRVVIINPANNMNINAANALLKTLEEPSAGALLMLISDLRNRLPATILSRCQRIVFPIPPQQQAMQWLQKHTTDFSADLAFLLQMAHGAPLAALQLLKDEVLQIRTQLFEGMYLLSLQQGDPLKLAANLQETDSVQLIDLAISWVCDVLRLQSGIPLLNEDYQTQLQEVGAKRTPMHCQRYLQHLQQLRKQLCVGMNVNKQLLVESILLQW